jgi:hypothetical protein
MNQEVITQRATNKMHMNLSTLKLGLIFFWAFWLNLTFLTNAFDGMKVLKVLPEEWKFASGNHAAIARATSAYSVPAWVNGLLFLGTTLWEGLASFLFWISFLSFLRSGFADLSHANTAFAFSLALWAVMILADEVFKVYRLVRTHMLIFVCQGITLLIIYALPG